MQKLLARYYIWQNTFISRLDLLCIRFIYIDETESVLLYTIFTGSWSADWRSFNMELSVLRLADYAETFFMLLESIQIFFHFV